MRIYSDNAVPTTVAAAGADTVTLADATGWPSPTGGDDATFRSLVDALNLRYTGRAGNVLSGVTRLDGSAIPALTVGSDARHLLAAEDMEPVVAHKPGWWSRPGSGGYDAASWVAGRLYLLQHRVERGGLYDGVGVSVIDKGLATDVAVGIYDLDPVSGRPTALLGGTSTAALNAYMAITTAAARARHHFLWTGLLFLGGNPSSVRRIITPVVGMVPQSDSLLDLLGSSAPLMLTLDGQAALPADLSASSLSWVNAGPATAIRRAA